MEIVLDEMLATLACQSLLYEAVTWPKPGLITAKSSGKHTDMNIYHFLDSSVGLYSYFKKLVLLVEGELTLNEIFEKSRELGKVAEERMYFETHGVNTHKGAIFILGLLVVTIAYCKKYNLPFKEIQSCVKEMTQDLVQRDFQKIHVP
ncbi:MAG: triphosphoribosyl-dephospho-CoA synthase, partial [Fusobacteria bacterium]|nr:triphosphoribosyl-dephospho-CoA synthase [Fusobacteriota bacterium]